MAKEAHFTTTRTNEGMQFDIVPASMPASFGCLMTCVHILAGAGALYLAVMGGSLLLAGFVANSVSFVASGVGLLAVSAGLILLLKLYRKRINKHDRSPVRLLVNASGIKAGDRFYPADQIRELAFGLPFDNGGVEMVQTTHTSISATAGTAIGMEIRNRSHALMARLASGSDKEILAFGLTVNTARSLLDDVQAALNGRL